MNYVKSFVVVIVVQLTVYIVYSKLFVNEQDHVTLYGKHRSDITNLSKILFPPNKTRNTLLPHKKESNNSHTKRACKKWKYIANEYTVVYLNVTYSTTQNCSLPNNEAVKKYITSNGDVVWNGCTNKTTRCKERPYFDYNNNIRINIPPCCRHHLMEMLKHLTRQLTASNITNMMVFGGIIGWHRNKDIIPYDADLDVIVDIQFWKSTVMDKLLWQLYFTYGYITKYVESEKIKLFFSKSNRLNIDIWPYEVETRKDKQLVYINMYEWKAQLYDTLIPPRLERFGDFKVFIPNKPTVYLNTQYGINKWKRPFKCTKRESSGNCLE